MSLPWLISLHTGQVFSTHMPQTYFALCLLHEDFFTRGSEFWNSCVLTTFCLVPPPWWISPHMSWIFSTNAPGAHLTLCFHYDRFFSRGSGFYDSCALSTIWFVSPPWQKSTHAGQVFINQVSQVYFALFLHHDGFLFTRIRFSRLSQPEHILSCASIMADFSSRESSFIDSRTSDTFCLILSPWWISPYISWAFSTCMPQEHFDIYFYCGRFFLTFCLMPLSWLIALYAGRVLSTYLPWAYFALCLCCNGFLLT